MQCRKICLIMMILCLFAGGCKKFVEANPPKNEVLAPEAFRDSSSALAALLHIYTRFGVSSGTIEGYFAPYTSLYADELLPVGSNPDNQQFYTNGIHVDNSINAATWQSLYAVIYESNAFVEGMASATGINDDLKSRYAGEAGFLRAFAYFLLVNCYGKVPLVLATDVTVTAGQPREEEAAVYAQVIKDLLEAAESLQEDYPSSKKIRANKWAALALLAKTQLYLRHWQEAEAAAGAVIQSGKYAPLEAPVNVFLANSKETILQVSENYGYTWSGSYFQPFFGSLSYELSQNLLQTFEAGDLRKQQWIDSLDDYGTMRWYPSKYKNNGFNNANSGEYTMCLRLGEQYLVRAEARCHLQRIGEAVEDINILRARAGIAPVAAAITSDSCLQLIGEERRRELFTEWGNRFFDLKRTGRADAVLGAVKPAWRSEAALYPVPQTEITYNSRLTQNPGY